MKSSRLILILLGAGILLAAYFLFGQKNISEDTSSLSATVTESPMQVRIQAPGELQARRSEKIKGPDGLRSVGLYQMTIQNLVPEGTVVNKGEFIASLDRTELDSKIKESSTEIEKIITQLDQAKIDTAIEMRSLRDQFINVKFSMEEKKLTLELSKYEPQAIRQQANLDLEKSQRELDQLQNKLELTKEKSIARIEEINASYRQQQFKLDQLLQFQKEMTITAPKSGMVIYIRSWNGKRGPGSQVSAWDPIVAELPDLSEMITKVYINEVDISKVLPGQPAEVTVDAFPGKSFPGMVISKANIGEQLRNFDTKVFEVVVLLHEQDSLLRPAMTTGISILVDSIPSALQIPLEAIFTDSLSFVYKEEKGGVIKQEVVTGTSNDIYISIEAGLAKGDIVRLTAPDYAEDLSIRQLDPEVKRSARIAFDEAVAIRMRKQQEESKKVKADDLPDTEGASSSIIFF